MNDIVLDENIENGEWPEEFSGAWMAICNDPVTTDVVCCLFFNQQNLESSLVDFNGIQYELGLPDAYISWKNNLEFIEQMGECREIFVSKNFRRRGIGTKLCAWARSYTYNNESYVFRAPNRMTYGAKSMYQNISNIYSEPFDDPMESEIPIPYSYWGGYFV